MADVTSVISQVSLSNTPSIGSSTTALAANKARGAWAIQNLGTNTLYVRLGSGASATEFHVALKGCTAQDDGSGGSLAQESGVVWVGVVTVAGTSPRYTVTELSS
jgi:hypothetical protein